MKNKSDTIMLSFLVSPEMKAELDALAEDLERNRSWLIRKAIQQYLDRI